MGSIFTFFTFWKQDLGKFKDRLQIFQNGCIVKVISRRYKHI